MFEALPIALNFAIFAGLAIVIWQAGTRLSYAIDAIAEQTHIARAFLGLILLATATELPELVTTLTATAQGQPRLALNNMFGGMMLQVAILAIADACMKDGTLTATPRKPTEAITGLCLLPPIVLLLMLYLTTDRAAVMHVGYGSLIVAGFYILSMYVLKRFQHRDTWSAVDVPNQPDDAVRENHYDRYSLRRLVVTTGLAAAVVLVCGVLLVHLADTLATQTGLGTSFVGATLLALTTSMPELSTSIAAVRVKAYTMAISNIFGSNLIMLFLLLPVDIAYTDGPVINVLDKAGAFALMVDALLVSIYCLGLLMRPRLRILRMGVDSALVLGLYITSLFVLYQLR